MTNNNEFHDMPVELQWCVRGLMAAVVGVWTFLAVSLVYVLVVRP